MADPAARCLKLRDRAVEQNPRVRHLLDALRKLGCDPGPLDTFIQCVSLRTPHGVPTAAAVTGGFEVPTPDATQPYVPKVVMIEDHLPDAEMFDRTLVHELVHAYDQCRATVDWRNRRHVACSEIRASNLSGECEFAQEINRGRVGFVNHYQKCVRRRAALSVALAHAASPEDAEAAVTAVYTRCYADRAPFEHETPTRPYSQPPPTTTTTPK